MTVPSKADLMGKTSFTAAFDMMPDKAQTCVCYMAYVAWKAKPELVKNWRHRGMRKLFFDIEMPVIYSLYHMQEGDLRTQEELRCYGRG